MGGYYEIKSDMVKHAGHAPTSWLKQDLEDARNRGAKHLFVFGHKMAYTYLYDQTAQVDGLETDKKSRDEF